MCHQLLMRIVAFDFKLMEASTIWKEGDVWQAKCSREEKEEREEN